MPEPHPRAEPLSTDDLIRELYDDLKRRADGQMRRERADHTLSPTALVHEAWLRVRDRPEGWANRAEFYFAAAVAMRRILIESARRRARDKRGGGQALATLGSQDMWIEIDPTDFLALEEALERLAVESPRAEKAAQLLMFAGLRAGEIADLLEVSVATIGRDIAFLRGFLGEALTSPGERRIQ